jgi:hypothetical protein
VTFVFLTGWHNSNGSYSFDGAKLKAKKNVNLNFIFASTANVKPLTANRGLRSGVNKINVNLKVSDKEISEIKMNSDQKNTKKLGQKY